MTIPIIPILVVCLLVALLFWVMAQLGVDAMIQNVVRVIVVVLVVLWLISLLLGGTSFAIRLH